LKKVSVARLHLERFTQNKKSQVEVPAMFAQIEEKDNLESPKSEKAFSEKKILRPKNVYPTDYLSLAGADKKATNSFSAFQPKLGYFKNRRRNRSLSDILSYVASGLLVVVIFFLIYLTNFTDFFRRNSPDTQNPPISVTTASLINDDGDSQVQVITYLSEDGYSTDDDSHSTNIDEAIVVYDLSPEHIQKLLERHHRALEAYNEQRYEDALALFRKLSFDFGTDYLSAYWAGLCCEKLGRYEEAKNWFELCLKMYSRYQPGLEKLEHIKILLGSQN
jgi:tetratricopeptide (TPR) repeat protein